MVEFNLLPWRLYKTRYEKKHLRIMIGITIIVTVLFLLMMAIVLELKNKKLSHEVMMLQSTNDKLLQVDRSLNIKKISNEDIASLGPLMKSQHHMLQLLHQLAISKPPSVCFTEITHTKKAIVFSGYAPSPLALTDFLIHWPVANLFTEIKLTELMQNKQMNRFEFNFSGISFS